LREIERLERRRNQRLQRQEERSWDKRMKKFKKEFYRRDKR
jgi:hypothetical protein